MKRRYRSKELVVVSILFGILLPAFGIGGILQGTDSRIGIVLGISTQLALAYVSIFRCARMGVYIDDEGVIVRNLFRSVRLSWNTIQRFELHPAGLLGETGYVQLEDDTGVRIWGIFPPNRAFRPANRDAEGLVGELNSQLRSVRARRD